MMALPFVEVTSESPGLNLQDRKMWEIYCIIFYNKAEGRNKTNTITAVVNTFGIMEPLCQGVVSHCFVG